MLRITEDDSTPEDKDGHKSEDETIEETIEFDSEEMKVLAEVFATIPVYLIGCFRQHLSGKYEDRVVHSVLSKVLPIIDKLN